MKAKSFLTLYLLANFEQFYVIIEE